ncbi:hypothetical protein L0Y69_01020 [bacterium]|nr:hypothetical protein [bacterium]
MIMLARVLASFLFIAVLAGEWDVWWHVTIGRDTFFEPPHIMLYGGIMGAVAVGVFGWWKTREKIWAKIAGALLAAPFIVAPLDELWHTWFGVENLTSPFIVWALPHILLIAVMILSIALTLPLVGKDENREAKRIFGAMLFAAILSLAMILAIPTNPIGAYHVIGFWGTILSGFFITFAFLSAHRWIGGFAPTLLFVAFYLVLYLAGVREKVGADIIIPPHATFPPWLAAFGYLIPAMWSDMTARLKRFPALFRGAGIALLWSAVLYGTMPYFIESSLHYGISKIFIAVFSATLGGLIASMIFIKITGEK